MTAPIPRENLLNLLSYAVALLIRRNQLSCYIARSAAQSASSQGLDYLVPLLLKSLSDTSNAKPETFEQALQHATAFVESLKTDTDLAAVNIPESSTPDFVLRLLLLGTDPAVSQITEATASICRAHFIEVGQAHPALNTDQHLCLTFYEHLAALLVGCPAGILAQTVAVLFVEEPHFNQNFADFLRCGLILPLGKNRSPLKFEPIWEALCPAILSHARYYRDLLSSNSGANPRNQLAAVLLVFIRELPAYLSELAPQHQLPEDFKTAYGNFLLRHMADFDFCSISINAFGIACRLCFTPGTEAAENGLRLLAAIVKKHHDIKPDVLCRPDLENFACSMYDVLERSAPTQRTALEKDLEVMLGYLSQHGSGRSANLLLSLNKLSRR